MSDENERISVSRDKLRADLAELELRLRTWIAAEMQAKADAKDVDALALRVDVHGQRLAAVEQRVANHERTLKEQQRIEGFNFTKKTLFVTASLWIASIVTPLLVNGIHP